MDDLKHLFTEHIDEIPEGQLVAFLNELLETGDKFKAGATSLEVIRNIKSYLPAKFHSTLQKLELEDLISYADEAGDFRFDIKWKAFDVNKEVSIFIDTKNYSTATNMFKDLGQYKAYLRAIDNFDQLYIIQQGGRGITKELVVRRLQSAIKKEINDVFEIIWKNKNLRTILFNNSRREKALEYFTISLDNKSYKLFDSILITK